ncbi:MAG: ribonuclease P protein component [Bacteroidaceae bacterium]|nr:ribonuclease P protein component [Bacteroidaceae bacterium]
MNEPHNSFCKQERINSKKAIEALFSGKAKSIASFPLLAVYQEVEELEDYPVAVLISVSKKRFKHAVQRNRIKRQIRETYRINKHALHNALLSKGKKMHIAFIYLDTKQHPTEKIEQHMLSLLERLATQIQE